MAAKAGAAQYRYQSMEPIRSLSLEARMHVIYILTADIVVN